MRGHRVQNKYTINFDKKIQEAMRRAGLSCKGKALSSYNLSVSLRSTAPLVGEPLAKPFTLRGLPRPLPLGEVARHRRDGEGKPVSREPPRSDRQALCRSDTIAVQSCLAAALPSQSHSVRQLPQRGSPWQAGPLPTACLRPDMAQKGGPCYRGQQLLDKRTLLSCRWPRQRSTTVPETSSFACPA